MFDVTNPRKIAPMGAEAPAAFAALQAFEAAALADGAIPER